MIREVLDTRGKIVNPYLEDCQASTRATAWMAINELTDRIIAIIDRATVKESDSHD